MKIKLLIGRGGPDVNDNAGDIVEVTADEAKRMIAAGQAIENKVEKATKKGKAENATKV